MNRWAWILIPLVIIALVAGVVVGIAPWKRESPPPAITHSLSASVEPSGGGTVALDPPNGTYSSGTQVTLTADPIPGYAFDHWSGDLSGTTNPTTVTIDSDKSVTAYFTPIILLSIELSPASASIEVGQTLQFTATATYSDGSTAAITNTAIWTSSNPLVATFSPGGLATGISSGVANITATVGTVQGSTSLTVTAAPTLYNLDISIDPSGSGSVMLNPPGGAYPSGT